MSLTNTQLDARHLPVDKPLDRRDRALELLGHRYVREMQHFMRFSQHAERMHSRQTRQALLAIAVKEAEHARWIAAKIRALGGELPEVIEVRCTNESNWDYLRSDLDEERRCMEEVEAEKLEIQAEYPDIAALFDLIEEDALKHREAIRELLRQSEPQTLWPS